MACGYWVRVVIHILERATVDLSNIRMLWPASLVSDGREFLE
jgi:hypothetical protein